MKYAITILAFFGVLVGIGMMFGTFWAIIILVGLAIIFMLLLKMILDGPLFPWEFKGEDGKIHDMYNMDDPYVQHHTKENLHENHTDNQAHAHKEE